MTDDQIKHLVDKFLSYRFPDDIQPDGGLSIRRVFNEGTPHEFKATPSGTNLLNAAQATEMVRHMTAGFPHTAGAIAAMGERDGWMPIESAPKDKELLIAYIAANGKPAVQVGRFDRIDMSWRATVRLLTKTMELHGAYAWKPLDIPTPPAPDTKGSGQ